MNDHDTEAATAEKNEAERQGRVAFHRDELPEACPYADGVRRELWLKGYDAVKKRGKTRPDMSQARGAGFRAFQDGVHRNECPYASRSQSGSDWLDGWDEAERIRNKNHMSGGYL